MTGSEFLTAFLALLLFAQGFSFPNSKNVDYADDNPEVEDDESPADYPSIAKEENTKPARLLSKNSTMEVSPGEQIILPCEIVNGDGPVVSWNKINQNTNDTKNLFFGDSSLLVNKSDINRISRTNNNSLVIKMAQVEDTGTYICKLFTDGIENPEVNYTVRVSDEPQKLRIFPGKTVVINETEDLTLNCSVSISANPSSLIWSHSSHKLHPILRQGNHIAEVHIKNASRHSAGFYQCLADFGPGKEPLHNVIDVTVRYAPEVMVFSDYVHSGVGQSANLTCIVYAVPSANITWTKRRGDVIEKIYNSNHIEIKDGKHIHNLTVKDIKKHDFGKYQCKAANEVGSHKKETELTGAPSKARFEENDLKDDDKTIGLKWVVESYSPITAYELRYRKSGAKNWITEKPKVTPGDGSNKYVAEHTIHNLEPNTYHFELRSENKFGWSEYSKSQSIEGPMPLMLNKIESGYKLQKAEIGGGASTAQPIMFLIALLLVVSPIAFKNL